MIGLPDRPNTRALNAKQPLLFDRTEPFGYKGKLNAMVIANWAIAEHKSQGTMQMLMNRGEVEQYFLSPVNVVGALERAKAFFDSLKGNPFPVKEYGPSAGAVPIREGGKRD